MSFIAGAAATNVDILFCDMPRMPAPGEEIYTDKLSVLLGGGLPGTLVNLGRLGVPVRIATELGDDMFSRFARDEFIKAGVDVRDLYRISGTDAAERKTGRVPVNITAAVILPTDRSFVSYGKGGLERGEANEDAFYDTAEGAKICLMDTGGYIGAYRRLKADGAVMVLDMGWDDDLSFDKYAELFELADYYTPNRKEAQKLTGCSDPRDALRALGGRFKKALVKLDAEGCLGLEDGREFFIPSVPGIKAVDSTGAGDAFLAGLCFGLFNDMSFADCIRLGNICGGRAVTAVGALSAYVTRAEMDEIISRGLAYDM